MDIGQEIAGVRLLADVDDAGVLMSRKQAFRKMLQFLLEIALCVFEHSGVRGESEYRAIPFHVEIEVISVHHDIVTVIVHLDRATWYRFQQQRSSDFACRDWMQSMVEHLRTLGDSDLNLCSKTFRTLRLRQKLMSRVVTLPSRVKQMKAAA